MPVLQFPKQQYNSCTLSSALVAAAMSQEPACSLSIERFGEIVRLADGAFTRDLSQNQRVVQGYTFDEACKKSGLSKQYSMVGHERVYDYVFERQATLALLREIQSSIRDGLQASFTEQQQLLMAQIDSLGIDLNETTDLEALARILNGAAAQDKLGVITALMEQPYVIFTSGGHTILFGKKAQNYYLFDSITGRFTTESSPASAVVCFCENSTVRDSQEATVRVITKIEKLSSTQESLETSLALQGANTQPFINRKVVVFSFFVMIAYASACVATHGAALVCLPWITKAILALGMSSPFSYACASIPFGLCLSMATLGIFSLGERLVKPPSDSCSPDAIFSLTV